MGRNRPFSPILFFLLVIVLDLARGLDYSGCESDGDRLCFGYPSGCLGAKSCEILFKSFFDGPNQKLNAELFGTNAAHGHYIVTALSLDNQMGNDSTTECTRLEDGTVVLRNGFNRPPPDLGNELRNITGIQEVSQSATNGIIHCEWTRDAETSHDGLDWNMKNPFYLLMAFGDVDSDGEKQYHGFGHNAVSPSAVNLTATGSVESGGSLSSPLAKAHGMLMIIAWIGFVSTGIIIARHCKNVLLKDTLFGVKMWFTFHRLCMSLALVSVVTAVTLMFIYKKGWGGSRPHPILGIVSSSFLCAQVVGALFRCGPSNEKRWIFNTGHFVLGNVTHVLSYAAIFTARVAVEVRYQGVFLSLLIAQVVSYALAHVVLEARTRLLKKCSSITLPSNIGVNAEPVDEETRSRQDDKFRIICVSVFAVVNVSITIMLCVIVGVSA